MIIAVDFDGTLCENAWPEIGDAKYIILNAVIDARCRGDKIILWTNREGEELEEAVRWCASHGLRFDAVNENLPELKEKYGNDTRKIGADIYIDDKAVTPDVIENRRSGKAEWKDYGDGVYTCSECGMPGAWAHPRLSMQSLGRYCSFCGALMTNSEMVHDCADSRVHASWVKLTEKGHQYACGVCGAKQSFPSKYCHKCGARMDDGAWEKRWAVRDAYEKGVSKLWE